MIKVLIGSLSRQIQKPSNIFKRKDEELDVMPLEILNEVMQRRDNLFGIDDLELGKLTEILPVAVLLVGHNEGSARVLLHLVVLEEQALVDHLAHVLEGLVDDGGDAAEVGGD